MRMASMLESALKPSADGRSQPVLVTPSPSTRAVSAERLMLLSSVTMADFVSWEEAWTDFAKCQHMANQDRETRVSAVRQSFHEYIQRYIRQEIIGVPTNADVLDGIASVKAYFRRQRNSLLDRINFYNRLQQPQESFDSFFTSLREFFPMHEDPESLGTDRR